MNRIRLVLAALAALALAPAAAAAQTVPDSVLAVTRLGVSLLRVNIDGKVGIGTSTPDRRLTVAGSIGAADTVAAGVAFRFPDGTVQTTAATNAGPGSGTSAATPNTLVARDANASFAAGKVTLDSLSVAGRTTLDSLTAGRAALDSITAIRARLDSLTASRVALDSLFGVRARLDSVTLASGGIRFSDGSLQTSAATTATGTSANTPNTLVQRDASGAFAAGEVTLDSLTAGKARLDSLAVTGSGIRGTKATLDSLAVAGRTTLGSSAVIVESNSVLSSGSDSVLTVRTGSDSRFRVTRNGGVLAIGSYDGLGSTSDVPIEGSGTRMMWYPAKAAFRAGRISGTQWDDANIGPNSVAFGEDARASGDGAVAMGQRAVAANLRTVAIGEDVTATGANSVVLGYKASSSTAAGSPRLGSFVFGDRSTTTDTIHATLTNSAHWRVANGFFIYTSSNLSTGVNVTAGGGSWNTVSDRNRKENFLGIDGEEVLARLRGVPVTTWNYIAEGRQVRHMGPMAQDWHAAFGFSGDSTHINTGDIDGVNLAGVKALDARTTAQEARIQAVERDNAALRAENAELRARLEAIERMLRERRP